ncbi:calcium channel, voltage-dependent, gamma subunit 6a isoform X2 [Denticeps clupeoides]|uniref:calcium channel, voltage-dependent, gamma subunit 6a isoform X2 n=1 Tax=Denticeps clupeoides TaxID=299321 RepID=UPI0010A5217E|nr:voltage-dependent calcium channel gamma-6 subunit-like isoform X2 [Denticeps clupeoides]
MWSTFFVQDEDGRPGGLAGVMVEGRAAKRRVRSEAALDDAITAKQKGRIKLVFAVAAVGIFMTMLGVGTDFWVELAPEKHFYSNESCLAVHYGIWKCCTKKLWIALVDPERESCGPADLPGESNCTYFKFFTTGENTVMFQKMTEKSLNVAAGLLSVSALLMMLTGGICILMALSKRVQFFLKPASLCFVLSGILLFLSLIIFHQSVLSLLAPHPAVTVAAQLLLFHNFVAIKSCKGKPSNLPAMARPTHIRKSLSNKPRSA